MWSLVSPGLQPGSFAVVAKEKKKKKNNLSSNYFIFKKKKKKPKSKTHFSKPNWAMDSWLEQSLRLSRSSHTHAPWPMG